MKKAQSAFKDKDFANLVYHLTLLDEQKRFNFSLVSNHPYFEGLDALKDTFDISLFPRKQNSNSSNASPVNWRIFLFVVSLVCGTLAGLLFLQHKNKAKIDSESLIN